MSGRYEVQNYNLDVFGVMDTRNKVWWRMEGKPVLFKKRSNAHSVVGALNDEDTPPLPPIVLKLHFYNERGTFLSGGDIVAPTGAKEFTVTYGTGGKTGPVRLWP